MFTLSRRSPTRHLACYLLLVFTFGCNLENKSPLEEPSRPSGHTLTVHRGELQDADEQLSRAAAWLWSQQAADGGWHSEQYALLESGQAYTPFVLHILLDVPTSTYEPPVGGVKRALQFLRRQINEQGVLGLADPDVLEYPNYATAYALRCFLQAGGDEDQPLIKRMRNYLVNQQYRGANGFGPAHLAHGGWGFGGVLKDGRPGHMDLAHTRRVLEALRLAGPIDTDVSERAKVFLGLVQRDPRDLRTQPSLQPDPLPDWDHATRVSAGSISTIPFDGGFYFSPIVLNANKGRETTDSAGSYFRSYASATCDGILALLATGVDSQDSRIQAAAHWLQQHPNIHYPAGIPQEHPEPWGEAIHFYHLSVRAEVGSRLKLPGSWQADIVHELASRQASDGSYRNKMSALMKEDDSLLATALAVQALKHVTNQATVEPTGH